MKIPQFVTTFLPPSRPDAGSPEPASPAPTDALAGSVHELHQEYKQLRALFAEPHEAIFQERDQHCRASQKLREAGEALASYQESLEMYAPAARLLGDIAASGKLEALHAEAAAEAAQTDGLGKLSIQVQRGLTRLLKDPGGDQEWTTSAAVRLAEGADTAAHLDQVLGSELMSGKDRQAFHPQPFVEGELTPKSLYGLGDSMSAEAIKIGRQSEEKLQAAEAEWQLVESAQNRQEKHWHSRHESFAQRQASARDFLSHLDRAEQERPGVARALFEECKQNKEYYPNAVLNSYRTQLAKVGGDTEKLNWGKLLGQLERTSLG